MKCMLANYRNYIGPYSLFKKINKKIKQAYTITQLQTKLHNFWFLISYKEIFTFYKLRKIRQWQRKLYATQRKERGKRHDAIYLCNLINNPLKFQSLNLIFCNMLI